MATKSRIRAIEKLVTVFAEIAGEYAFKGAAPPECHKEIDEAYNKAKDKMVYYISALYDKIEEAQRKLEAER